MAITPKSFASWGLLTEESVEETRFITAMDVEVESDPGVNVEIETLEVTVEISNETG